ncbi:MAG TPA: MHYT domain-containing protein [Steroidobacteraceae bacterium]|nr:MHYT domain-containing protein [Steroidobacteraceae bacterium]
MQATYNFWLVALSILVAIVVSYTALTLAGRIAHAERSGGRLWLFGGAAAMGIGIWSMHFIGMLAFSVAIPLRYNVVTTLLSLVIGILTSGFALHVAGRRDLTLKRLTAGSVIMGSGICGMHYSGMAAIQIMPAIQWDPVLVGASFAIAVTASFAALWLAFNLRSGKSWLALLARAGAAIIMGLAITGMHYTAMAAAMLAPGSFCVGGATLDNAWLALTIGVIALALLAITLITAVYDAHLESRTRRDALHLAELNADLQHGKNLLTLATQAAGILCWEYDVTARSMLWTENEIASLRAIGIDPRKQIDALLALVHPGDLGAAKTAIKEAAAARRDTCTARARLICPSGDSIHLQAHARLFFDEGGQLRRLLGVTWDITDQLRQEEQKLELQMQLRDVSRQAGMAEVATGVLHSIGNVLNSLGVAVALLQSGLRDSRVGNVQRVAKLLSDQGAGLGNFLDNEPRGREIPGYLTQLGESLGDENEKLLSRAKAIVTHVEHIAKIVAAQQTYARRGGISEQVDIAELVDHAIALNFAADTHVVIHRHYDPLPSFTLDRHKLIQIVANLLSNARHALHDQTQGAPVLTVRIGRTAAGGLSIEIQDSGAGIDSATHQRLFEFGFTTKKDGHGFGLHSSAILAKELGGELTGSSEGKGRGACFTLRLPLAATQGQEDRRRA